MQSIVSLPPELLNQCLLTLSFRDLMQVRATCVALHQAVKNLDHGTALDYLSGDTALPVSDQSSEVWTWYEKNYDRLHFGNVHLYHLPLLWPHQQKWILRFPRAPIDISTLCHVVTCYSLYERMIGPLVATHLFPDMQRLSLIEHVCLSYLVIPCSLCVFLRETSHIQSYELHSVTTVDVPTPFSVCLFDRKDRCAFRKAHLGSLCWSDTLTSISDGIETMTVEDVHGMTWVSHSPQLHRLDILYAPYACSTSVHPQVQQVIVYKRTHHSEHIESARIRFPNAAISFADMDSLPLFCNKPWWLRWSKDRHQTTLRKKVA